MWSDLSSLTSLSLDEETTAVASPKKIATQSSTRSSEVLKKEIASGGTAQDGRGRPEGAEAHKELGPREVKFGDTIVTVRQRDLIPLVFNWIAERHQIFERRLAGEPRPWTKDKILAKYNFVNVYRVLDRCTQYLIQHVLKEGDQDHVECCFRVILYRLFNRIETWEHLVDRLGPKLTWRDFDLSAYERVLRDAFEEGPLYTSSYIIPAPHFGHAHNYQNHLRLLQVMMESDLPNELSRVKHIYDAFEIVHLYPSMGDFLAFQLVLDLNMTPLINYSEDEWAPVGPGSRRSLRRIFGSKVSGKAPEAMAWLCSLQDTHWKRLGYKPSLRGGHEGVTVVDMEHSLCEVDKYLRREKRGTKPELNAVYKGKGVNGKPLPVTYHLPEEWKEARSELEGERSDTAREGDEDEDGDSDVYEVSHIVNELPFGNNGRQYRVRWAGYGPDEDEWIEEEELQKDASEAVEEWKERLTNIQEAIDEFGTRSTRKRKRVRTKDKVADPPAKRTKGVSK